MLLTILEAPVAFIYAITGNIKFEKLAKRMQKLRKRKLDKFIKEHPKCEFKNYKEVEIIYFLTSLFMTVAFIAFCILITIIIGSRL